MRCRSSFKLLCLVPTVLVTASFFTPTIADEHQPDCALSLGQVVTQPGKELDGELEVLSWNIQKASNTGWAEDLVSFSQDIDLAFIQEASVGAQIPQIISTELYPAFAAGYTTADLETGVLTLSAGTPSVQCNLTALEPWLGTPKATSITEYPLLNRDDRLLAINLHAINFDLGLESLQSQFDALREVLAGHAGPVILAGDLNTWSSDRELLVHNFLTEYGLASVVFEPDLRTRAFGRALDHIYVRGLRADNARVIPVSSSDHNPLRVRLAIL